MSIKITDPFSVDRVAAFWTKVDTNGPINDVGGRCWNWMGVKDDKGYGMFSSKHCFRAHRYALIISGVSVPRDMLVDHKCRNHSCVNPDHLRVVTSKVNTLENSESIAAINKGKAHCKNGHEFTPANTKFCSKGRYCGICSAEKSARYRAKLSKQL